MAGNRRFLADHGIGEAGSVDGNGGVSEVWVVRNRTVLGAIFIADGVRPEAAPSVDALHRLGIRTVLLTGDSAPVAERVAAQLKIDEVRAQLLPDEKAGLVQQFGAEGHRVAMVGDGVNDAPALMRAAVGIAMGSGTDVARESADVVLLGNDLSKMVETVRIARRARAIIQFNFVGTLAVDGAGVALAAFGMLNPLLAAFIHVASELTFIANSARLVPGLSPRVH